MSQRGPWAPELTVEDVQDIINGGMTHGEAVASRLGISLSSLDQFLRRRDAQHVLAQLTHLRLQRSRPSRAKVKT